ncbi:MAG TPA: hypothetical protein VGI81_26275 [Tepidisphaeraceae bacterium]
MSSVVTRDVPDDVFAAGNPSRVIRPITPADRPPHTNAPDAAAFPSPAAGEHLTRCKAIEPEPASAVGGAERSP